MLRSGNKIITNLYSFYVSFTEAGSQKESSSQV